MPKSVRLKIALALLLVALCVAIGTYLLTITQWWVALFAFIPSVWAIRWMLRLPFHFEERLRFIVGAIANKDYSFHFNEKDRRDDINLYLNSIKQMLMDARFEVEENERYLEHILAHIDTGILVCNAKNSILRSNEAAKRILSVSVLQHLDNLAYIHPALLEAFERTTTYMPQTYTFTTERQEVKIHIQLTQWTRSEQLLNIYTINDISTELDQHEMESWTRLSRVLTHEIMNALTPIISLSDSLANSPNITDPNMQEGLHIIGNTGRSLVSFVDNYHRFSRIPSPNMAVVLVNELLQKVFTLLDVKAPRLSIASRVEPLDLMIHADELQVQQVILNLLKNAYESIGDEVGEIMVEAFCAPNEDVVVRVSDSGPRIPEEVVEHIFVPFFTTKKSGSGIGLSLARQIMRNHHGSLHLVQNKKAKTFVLTFR